MISTIYRIAQIGEATHGTQEFYEIRAELTKMLIKDHGFNIVCAEADWPDAYRVSRYVCGQKAGHMIIMKSS